MIIQLNPPIPVCVLDKGKGLAHALIDYGIEHHLHWVVFIDSTTECWTVPNTKIRAQFNETLSREPMKILQDCACECHSRSGHSFAKLSFQSQSCCNCHAITPLKSTVT